MSLLVRFVDPPAAEVPAPLAFFVEPERRRSLAQLGGAAALILAPILSPPAPVQAEHAHRSRPESRSAPYMPDAVRVAPPPVGGVDAHARRVTGPERSTTARLDASLLAPPPPVVPETRRTPHHEDRSATALLNAALLPLPTVVVPENRRTVHHQDMDPLARIVAPPPSVDPRSSSGGAWKRKKSWINLQATAVEGRVVLTIEELLEPEPPQPVALDPRLVEILADAPGLEIHDTPELRGLRAEVAALRAAKRAGASELERSERTARRWRFGAVTLAVVLALVGAKRRR